MFFNKTKQSFIEIQAFIFNSKRKKQTFLINNYFKTLWNSLKTIMLIFLIKFFHNCNTFTHLFPMYPLFNPWKHQKILQFSDVFRVERKGTMGNNELITTNCKQQFPVDLQQLTDSMLTNIFRIFKCFW